MDQEAVGTPEAARVEALLRDAASFVPEHAAPDGLCSRALAQRPVRAPIQRRAAATLLAASGGAAALAAFSIACAVNFIIRPKITSDHVAATGAVATAPVIENTDRIAQSRALPESVDVVRDPERLRLPHHSRFKVHRLVALHRPARGFMRHSIAVQKSLTQVAALTEKPTAAIKSCWTTEDVQETSYVLVSPGIVTDGSGDTERATPVLVQLPMSGDLEASEGDEPTSVSNPASH